MGYSPCGCKELDMTDVIKPQQYAHPRDITENKTDTVMLQGVVDNRVFLLALVWKECFSAVWFLYF